MNFSIYDVFADAPYQGNPAAVVNGQSISDASLVTLAQELNFPETVYTEFSSGELPEISLRFSTTSGILPRCGHGLLAGIADCCRRIQQKIAIAGGKYVLSDGVNGTWELEEHPMGRQLITATWPEAPSLEETISASSILKAVGLQSSQIVHWPEVEIYNSGNRNALIRLNSVQALNQINVNWDSMSQAFAAFSLVDLCPYHFSASIATGEVHVTCRNLFPYGVREEYGTGSAAVSIAAAILNSTPSLMQRAECVIRITQGTGLRTGQITIRTVKADSPSRLTFMLSGNVFLIGSGSFSHIP